MMSVPNNQMSVAISVHVFPIYNIRTIETRDRRGDLEVIYHVESRGLWISNSIVYCT